MDQFGQIFIFSFSIIFAIFLDGIEEKAARPQKK